MKKITMTFSVLVDDEHEFDGRSITDNELMKGLYDHICEWEGNIHGTVEVEHDDILPYDEDE